MPVIERVEILCASKLGDRVVLTPHTDSQERQLVRLVVVGQDCYVAPDDLISAILAITPDGDRSALAHHILAMSTPITTSKPQEAA